MRLSDLYEDDSAPVRFRQLLKSLRIPRDIPDSLPAASRTLQRIGNPEYDQDGPEVIAALRNRLVHPNEAHRRDLKQLTVIGKHQVKELAIWYLELSLLGLLGYQGTISNRTDLDRHRTDSELVPWANP